MPIHRLACRKIDGVRRRYLVVWPDLSEMEQDQLEARSNQTNHTEEGALSPSGHSTTITACML